MGAEISLFVPAFPEFFVDILLLFSAYANIGILRDYRVGAYGDGLRGRMLHEPSCCSISQLPLSLMVAVCYLS
jgi:hypothetical protein